MMFLTIGQLVVFSVLTLFASIGVGALAYILIPEDQKHLGILCGIISIVPVLAALFYVTAK